MLCADPEIRETRRFLVGPNGCEVTGVVVIPDERTMLVGIQHPGEAPHRGERPRGPQALQLLAGRSHRRPAPLRLHRDHRRRRRADRGRSSWRAAPGVATIRRTGRGVHDWEQVSGDRVIDTGRPGPDPPPRHHL